MQTLDWIILAATLSFIVVFGWWKTKNSRDTVDDYVRGRKDTPWWAIGLSVMATQASAITFLSTPGQAYHDGMGFVQFYFGLPLAMVVICAIFIPIYHRKKVYTAYELLEQRFDTKTRTLTALLFLIQRGLAAGITIFAPAIILSAVLGWPLNYLNIGIGTLVILYTVSGGTQAVSITQKQQMFVIMVGMFFAFFYVLGALPDEITFSKALKIAGSSDKLNILDFSLDLNNRYTLLSGLTGGFFLALAYFGTDQSQVQRYLTGRSVAESQWGLIFNGLLKIPMQFFILLVGVMVFIFYQFNASPLHFNPTAEKSIQESALSEQYQALETNHQQLLNRKSRAHTEFATALDLNDLTLLESSEQAMQALQAEEKRNREAARSLIKQVNPDAETNDKDYVFIHFILNSLPSGLIGLLLAVILSAAMSSTSSELNALGTTTTVDLFLRHNKKELTQKQTVRMTQLFTLGWGVIAILIACVADLFENLIQLVNIIGSIFYGNVLGIFLLAFFFKWVKGNAVFIAAIITQIIVLLIFFRSDISYLLLNFIGCAIVILFALILEVFDQYLGGKQPVQE